MGVKTFLLMAGGTGGHIFPALAVAAALRERGHKVVWLGSEGAMETRIVPQHGIEIETLAIKGVRGNGLKRKLMLPFTLWHTIRAARRIIRKHQVDGAIEAAVVHVAGTVNGPIRASKRLVVQSGARLNGDLLYRDLQLEYGALVTGSLKSLDSDEVGLKLVAVGRK